MQGSVNESPTEIIRRDSTKIYFFVLAILALLATNIYFYVKYKNTGSQVYELTHEKINLQAEIDRIELELDRLSNDNIELSNSLILSRDSARTAIADLRRKLDQQNLTQQELLQTRQEIGQLRSEVSRYVVELENLRTQNTQLISDHDRLQQEVHTSSTRMEQLEEENTDLSDKVKRASAIKVSSMSIVGIRERSKGREAAETRTRRVDRFNISFTIADNPLAKEGLRDIYLRIIDPNGNLRTPEGNHFFEVDGNSIQYTHKTSIEFSNDGKLYNIAWRDSKPFQKGTYTVLLYSDNAVMGRSSIVLK